MSVVFIVGSGRSGTAALSKALGSINGVLSHHEWECVKVAKEGCIQQENPRRHFQYKHFGDPLDGIYKEALEYTSKDSLLWIDSSNKCSWLIRRLYNRIPGAKFVNVVRDGRKVVASYLYKLSDEVYTDEGIKALDIWLRHFRTKGVSRPPMEKQYWWPLPKKNTVLRQQFTKLSQLERLCWYWGEVNRVVLQSCLSIPAMHKWTSYRLEDLVKSQPLVDDLCEFMGLSNLDAKVVYEQLQRPFNVGVPKNASLNDNECATLMKYSRDMMTFYGYDREEQYRVHYENEV